MVNVFRHCKYFESSVIVHSEVTYIFTYFSQVCSANTVIFTPAQARKKLTHSTRSGTYNGAVGDNCQCEFHGIVHLQFTEHWEEFSTEFVFSLDELSSVFARRTVNLFSYVLPVPTAVKEANGRLRMV